MAAETIAGPEARAVIITVLRSREPSAHIREPMSLRSHALKLQSLVQIAAVAAIVLEIMVKRTGAREDSTAAETFLGGAHCFARCGMLSSQGEAQEEAEETTTWPLFFAGVLQLFLVFFVISKAEPSAHEIWQERYAQT